MTSANPIITAIPPVPAGSTSASTGTRSISELGPNAFITLLTAQLQAQDPLNPMDPNQMVNELTSMNTLQETIQIRQDMDSLVASTSVAAPTGGTGSPASPVSPSVSATSPHSAAGKALTEGLAALTNSLAPASSTNLSSQLKSQLKLQPF
jgi:flagellar basal-body rod modification protein FlgD